MGNGPDDLEAGPGRGQDGSYPAGFNFAPEIYPGFFLLLPDAGNQPAGQPGGSPEKNVPEILRGAVNDPWESGGAWGAWKAGWDPGRLAEALKQSGYFPAGLSPGEAAPSEAGFRQVCRSRLVLFLLAGTVPWPPGQADTGGPDGFGVYFGPADAQVQPAELNQLNNLSWSADKTMPDWQLAAELNQLNNLRSEMLLFSGQQKTTGVLNPEEKTETVNSPPAPGFGEALAARPELEGAGIPDSVNFPLIKVILRQGQAFLLPYREQVDPENFREPADLEASGEGGSTVKPGPEPAAKEARMTVEIVRQEGFPPAGQNYGGRRGEILPVASINRQNLPDGFFLNEKGFSTGTPGKNFTPLIFSLFHGNDAAGAVHPGGGQGSVDLRQIPPLVVQMWQQAAGGSSAGETRLRFRLEPEHLGELTIRLIFQHDEVSAHFLASNAQAREAIENSLPQLREALAGQNLHLQNVSVSVGQESDCLPRENYGQAGHDYPRRGGAPGPEADRPGAGGKAGTDPADGRVNLWI